MAAPSVTPADLAAYRAGTLSLDHFERVDAWLASLPGEEQERLLVHDEEAGTMPAAPIAPLSSGSTFQTDAPTGRFEPRGTLGQGGMGLVELVYDRVLEREVALKRCRPRAPDESPTSHALRLRLFRREAAVTARLEHPGIVPLHDVGIAAAGEPAYVMKRLQGTTLAAKVPMPAAEAAVLLLRVADAVAFAHRQGVVHRDLKPEHVWLGADGEVLLLDWGLAGTCGSTLAADGALGTPPWRAPEQTAAAPADPRMDVWGLGGLILATLTGKGPDAAVPPTRGLGAIARRCLNLDPAQRYQDGAAVAADIRQWLRVGLAAAEKPHGGQLLLRWLRRHPLMGLAMGAVLVALGSSAWERHVASRSAQAFLEAPLPGAEALMRWRSELADLPATATVQRARARIERAEQIRYVQEAASHYRRTGPWPEEINDLREACLLYTSDAADDM
jgi:tRNA A-37 threonylcarbamoyl transferase component Bud32